MFGRRRQDKTVAPVQGATLTASTKASIEPSKLMLVHSRGQGSTPTHKALMAHVLFNPPSHTNAILAQGLASRSMGEFTNTLASLSQVAAQPTPITMEPTKGDLAWDHTNPR